MRCHSTRIGIHELARVGIRARPSTRQRLSCEAGLPREEPERHLRVATNLVAVGAEIQQVSATDVIRGSERVDDVVLVWCLVVGLPLPLRDIVAVF